MIDTHVHLNLLASPHDSLKRASLFGLTGIVAVSEDPGSYRRTVELAQSAPLPVYVGCGLHPEWDPVQSESLPWFEETIRKGPDQIAVIGEIGLPSYRSVTPRQWRAAIALAERQLRLAVTFRKPVVLHAVHRAAEPMLEILSHYPVPAAVFHWLKAPPAVMHRIAAAGYYVGLTPDILWRSRDHQVLVAFPPDRILLETDAPWSHAPGQKTSEPSDIAAIGPYLDRVMPLVSDSWSSMTYKNALRFLKGEMVHPVTDSEDRKTRGGRIKKPKASPAPYS